MNFFEHFFNGNMNNMNIPEDDGPVNNTKFYDLLGVSKDATDKEIRKAYLKRSLKDHPDKGGDPEKFKELSMAYDVLKDKKQREMYDKYGEKILNQQFRQMNEARQSGMPPGFGNMFGFRRNSNNPSTGKSTVFKINVSLEELCRNTTKKLKITRKVIYNTKNNHILEDSELENSWEKCNNCGGSGKVKKIIQMGPNMIQQMLTNCTSCTDGFILKPDYDIKNNKEIITLFIEKGSKHGDKIKFHNKANVNPGKKPGDLIIELVQNSHHLFERKENDLLFKKNITIDQAICGFHYYLEHPDGRVIKITNPVDIQLSPLRNVTKVKNGGMPVKNDIYTYGDLYIIYTIRFPKKTELSSSDYMMITKLFSSIKNYKNRINSSNFIPDNEEDIDELTSEFVNLSNFGKKTTKQTKDAHDSDSEEEYHQRQPTQCKQM